MPVKGEPNLPTDEVDLGLDALPVPVCKNGLVARRAREAAECWPGREFGTAVFSSWMLFNKSL